MESSYKGVSLRISTDVAVRSIDGRRSCRDLSISISGEVCENILRPYGEDWGLGHPGRQEALDRDLGSRNPGSLVRRLVQMEQARGGVVVGTTTALCAPT